MTRPEHVRCENCCYWNEGTPHVEHGECVRYPQSRLKLPGYCGEFRAEWPEPRKEVRIVWDAESDAWKWWEVSPST